MAKDATSSALEVNGARPKAGGNGEPVESKPAAEVPAAAPVPGSWQFRAEAARKAYVTATVGYGVAFESATEAWGKAAYSHLLACMDGAEGKVNQKRSYSTALLREASGREVPPISDDYKVGALLVEFPKIVEVAGARAMRHLVRLVDWDEKAGVYVIDANIQVSIQEWLALDEGDRTMESLVKLRERYRRGVVKRAANPVNAASENGSKKPAAGQAERMSQVLLMADKPGEALGKLLESVPENDLMTALVRALPDLEEPADLVCKVLTALAASVLAVADEVSGQNNVLLEQAWGKWASVMSHASRTTQEVEAAVLPRLPAVQEARAKKRAARKQTVGVTA